MFFILFLSFFVYAEKVFYNLNVKITPFSNSISLEGYIEFENDKKQEFFYLNNSVKLIKNDYFFEIEKKDNDLIFYRIYDKNGRGFRRFYISYEGNFNYPLIGDDVYARGMKTTKGIISEEGCFLTNQSGWYPVFENKEIYFDIKFYLPKEYEIIMPGFILENKISGEERIIRYSNKKPVFELAITCGRYKTYSLNSTPPIYVYMLSSDDEIAKKYLEYSSLYIRMYENLIGKYPYEKFAIVENFWETGFAFPSFTLLGKSVMRFPFIFISSLPHEILHNWWGNGVYVDYDSGNWSEGLTTYLADYMFSEQRDRGRDYRMNILKKYTDYLKEDIPLKSFKERHSNETEAVGYGKSMMLFHMIRREMGDEKFIKSLKEFYNRYVYKKASWNDLRKIFEKYSKKDYSNIFEEFLNKKGFYSAVLLNDSISVKDNLLSFDVLNNGDFNFQLPLRLYYRDKFEDLLIKLNRGINSFKLPLKDKVYAICLDCEFDVLRKLSENETPTTFSKLISSKDIKLFSHIELRDIGLKVNKDTDTQSEVELYVGKKYIKDLPQNDFINFRGNEIIIDKRVYDLNENQFAFIFNVKDRYYTYLLCDDGCKSILNKIFHYGKYSYLIFDKNSSLIDSGVWELKNRDNLFKFEKDYNLYYEKRKPIYRYVSFFNEKSIEKHIKFLSYKIKTRHPGSKGLEEAKKYIEKEFKKIGLMPLFSGSYEQKFDANILGKTYNLSNVCAKTYESSSYLVISAHYDHLFPKDGFLYPGANDNASGVAALLEFARLAKTKGKKGLIFCAFSGEEYQRVGSKHFLRNNSYKIYANINLDTIGRLNDNEVVILNSESSYQWSSIIRKASLATGLNYKLAKNAISSSDDFSFVENQIPAIQIYDGSVDDYHKPSDTFSKINFNGIVRILDFLKELVDEVEKREGISFDRKKSLNEIVGKRTFSLGFAPDFTYSGEGVRIKKINPNSVLLKYGFKEGDIILGINGIKIRDIFDYTSLLNSIDAYKNIYIDCLCGGETIKIGINIE